MSPEKLHGELQKELHEKPLDWLPKGPNFETEYIEWGPGGESRGLKKRIGKPRIEDHPYYKNFVDKVGELKGNNHGKVSYFEAGAGHGNDFRKVIDLFLEEGIELDVLGVEYSIKELKDGLEYYNREQGEAEQKRNTVDFLVQGDLRDLKNIKFRDPKTGEYTRVEEIEDNSFDVVYFEAILHAFGMGLGSYKEKKANAMKMLKELNRIAKPGAMFFGRGTVWGPDDQGNEIISKEDQFKNLREWNEWRFIPGNEQEFIKMLEEAGFEIDNMEIMIRKNEKRPRRKNWPRVAFMCKKPENK